MADMLCFTCGLRPRRHWRDSMCKECRNEYVRLWKAKKRHGPDLEGYNPRPGKEAPTRVKIRYQPKKLSPRWGLTGGN